MENEMYNERSPVPGFELQTPSRIEQTLTTMPQPHAWGRRVIYIMVIDNNDSGTFRPVAIMIVGKAEIKEAFTRENLNSKFSSSPR